MARRRFFVDEVRGGRAQILGDDAHHLTRVLRVETGQKYEISDNASVYLAEIDTARKDLVSFSVVEKLGAAETLLPIAIVAALIKFDRFEWLVEKATELGVASIVPFMADRSEKGLDRAAGKRVSRWRKIAREASEQSRRSKLPEIADLVSSAEALDNHASLKLVLEEQADTAPLLTALPASWPAESSVAILVGPEGGWTDRERSAFKASQWTPASLGNTILRAETAAIAGLAVILSAWNASNHLKPAGSS